MLAGHQQEPGMKMDVWKLDLKSMTQCMFLTKLLTEYQIRNPNLTGHFPEACNTPLVFTPFKRRDFSTWKTNTFKGFCTIGVGLLV